MGKTICPVCQNAPAIFFVEKNNHNVFRCQKCGLLFVWPVPNNFIALYGEDYFSGAKNKLGYADYEADREILAGTFKKYLKRLEKFCSRKGKLLDVGAATGHFLELAQKSGWEIAGVEVSPYAAKKAREKGLQVKTDDFESGEFEKNFFDAITFWDVLEHFSSPEAAIAQARKSLKTGGLLAMNTPDSRSRIAKILGRRWHAIVPPNHLHLFNRKNLEKMLERNGFQVVEIGRVGKKFSFQTIFKVMANWKKSAQLEKISNYFLKKRIGSLHVYLNLRDNLFLVAKKK